MIEQEQLPATAEAEGINSETTDDGDSSSPTSILDIEPRMELAGKVKSITDFGAFIDLGIAQDGLVHISELVPRRVTKVSDVVQVGDEVRVWVKKVDKKRGRISLTMVKPVTRRFRDIKESGVLDGVVTRIESYGVFVDIGAARDGLVHISELAEGYINAPEEVVSVGDKVQVRVLRVDRKARKVDLSMKEFIKAPEPQAPEPVEEVAEQDEPAQTLMALAFQASLEDDGKDKKQRRLEKMIANSLKR